MSQGPSAERFVVRLLPVNQGFYLLTYVNARDPRSPPRIMVTQRPGSRDEVSFLHSPDVEDGLLQPGQAVAVACRRATEILVTTCAQGASVSDDVELRFDRLGGGEVERVSGPAAALRAAKQAAAPISAGPARGAARPVAAPSSSKSRPARDTFSADGSDDESYEASDPDEGGLILLAGHVQAAGDVEAGPDGWLGSARGRRWIEGFSASWQESLPGVRLTYAVDVEGNGRSKLCLAGQFAGTRRRAVPLTGVMFELAGPRAAEHELVVRASFLNSPVQEEAGRRVELMGPTGDEPLTGLWVNVRKVVLAQRPKSKPVGAAKGRLRVFRAQ